MQNTQTSSLIRFNSKSKFSLRKVEILSSQLDQKSACFSLDRENGHMYLKSD